MLGMIGTLCISATLLRKLQGWAGDLTHGWVDFDLDVPPFCLVTQPIQPKQTVERHKSMSTQPRSQTTRGGLIA